MKKERSEAQKAVFGSIISPSKLALHRKKITSEEADREDRRQRIDLIRDDRDRCDELAEVWD